MLMIFWFRLKILMFNLIILRFRLMIIANIVVTYILNLQL